MKEFNKKILIQSIACLIFIVGPLIFYWDNFINEFICAFFLSLANLLVSNYLINISFERPNSEYLQVVYGGMIIRLGLVLCFSLFMTMNNYFETIPFFLSLFLFYVIHQWTEISYWHKNLPKRKVPVS